MDAQTADRPTQALEDTGHRWSGSSCAYLSFRHLTDMAHIVSTFALCDAMSGLGIATELFLTRAAGQEAPSAHELQERFGLEREPVVSWIPHYPSRWIERARILADSWRAGRRHDFVYTRKALPAFGALVGGCPAVILEYHQIDANRHGRLAFHLARRSRRLHVVCISKRLAELIAEDLGLDESRIIVEHSGTKMPIRDDYDPAAASGRRLVATYVGTFMPGRGLDVILEMARRRPQVDFVVVGGDVVSDHVPSNVDVRGRVPHGEVAAILAEADVLLMPYARNVILADGKDGGTGEYCSPLKMFEYLAAGRAIISSELPSIAEVLIDGSNALLVGEGPVDGWLEALDRLSSDPELRRRLAHGAACTAAHHTLEKRVSRILDEVWSRRQ